MIQVTRLNGQVLVINADKIRYVEATPDTMVCVETGEKLLVKETVTEVVRRAVEYARTVRQPLAV